MGSQQKGQKENHDHHQKNQVKQEPGEEQPKDPQDVIIESADQTGDIRYFDKIQWCVETRLKLLGFFRMNQYAKTLDQGQDDEQHQTGVVIYIPDNNRQ